jgi:hypothetical protein
MLLACALFSSILFFAVSINSFAVAMFETPVSLFLFVESP